MHPGTPEALWQGLPDAGKLRMLNVLHRVRAKASPQAPLQPPPSCRVHAQAWASGQGPTTQGAGGLHLGLRRGPFHREPAPPQACLPGSHQCTPLPAALPRRELRPPSRGQERPRTHAEAMQGQPTAPAARASGGHRSLGDQLGHLQLCVTTSHLPQTKFKL